MSNQSFQHTFLA